ARSDPALSMSSARRRDRGRVAPEERMRARWRRTRLRQEEGPEKERMLGNLDNPDFSGAAHSAHAEPAVLEPSVVVGIDAVVAVVVLDGFASVVERCRTRPGTQEHRLLLSNE